MIKVKVSVAGHAPEGDLIRLVAEGDAIPKKISREEFDGTRFQTMLLREEQHRIFYIGLGDIETVDVLAFSRAVGLGIKEFLKIGVEAVSLDLASFSQYLPAAIQGAFQADYFFEDFCEKGRKKRLKRFQLLVPAAQLSSLTQSAKEEVSIAEAVNWTRALGNQPPNFLTPQSLAIKAREMARKKKLQCRVWDEPQLKREGFGGIVAVGKGSSSSPRMIVLEHWGDGKKKPPVVLVGKAVTFDSGGLCLKPRDNMDEMKWDKMGGCAVLGVMQAIATLKLPLSVVAVVPSAENMTGEGAYRPGDILRTYDGKTIEVLNTDAEGRILLADALAFARLRYRPRYLIDMATLTGACVVALGSEYAGLFTQSKELQSLLSNAAQATGDSLWPMPIGGEYDELVKSDVATTKNIGSRWGGASFAATFLKVWAEEVPFAHIDIAGTAWTAKELPYLEKGATGFGVRLLVEALRQLAQ